MLNEQKETKKEYRSPSGMALETTNQHQSIFSGLTKTAKKTMHKEDGFERADEEGVETTPANMAPFYMVLDNPALKKRGGTQTRLEKRHVRTVCAKAGHEEHAHTTNQAQRKKKKKRSSRAPTGPKLSARPALASNRIHLEASTGPRRDTGLWN